MAFTLVEDGGRIVKATWDANLPIDTNFTADGFVFRPGLKALFLKRVMDAGTQSGSGYTTSLTYSFGWEEDALLTVNQPLHWWNGSTNQTVALSSSNVLQDSCLIQMFPNDGSTFTGRAEKSVFPPVYIEPKLVYAKGTEAGTREITELSLIGLY